MKLKKIITISLIIMSLQNFAQSLTNQQIKDSITSILKKAKVPSTYVTVVSKDSVLFQHTFGYINEKQTIKGTNKHLFALGSISKTFTSIAIMKLIKEGKLSLEDELKNIIPEIPISNRWEKTNPIKIKHLLTHRSGFDDMHIADIIKKRNSKLTALEEVLTYKKSYKSNWKPGLVFSYSNPGYVLLGYIIEKTSGITYQEYIKHNILKPLKMNDTEYYSTINKSTMLVRGFKKEGEEIIALPYPKLIGESAGALVSNANNMAKFLQYILNKEIQKSANIITTAQILAMEKLQSKFEIVNNVKYGYSMGIYDRDFGEKEYNFKGHNGSIDGFSSDYIYNRQLNIGIAVSNNLFGKSNRKIIDLLVNNYGIKPQNRIQNKEEKRQRITQFKKWKGTYKMLNNTNMLVNFINAPFRTIEISIKKDTLYTKQFGDEKIAYQQLDKNSFNNKEDKEATLYLCTNEGEKALVYYEDTFVKINPIIYYVNLILLCLGLLSGLLLTLLFIVQLIMLPFKKQYFNSLKITVLITLPFWLIIGSLVIYLSNRSYLDLPLLGNITTISVTLFILTLLYPFICLFTMYKIYKKELFSKKSKFTKLYYITFIGIAFLSFYSLYYGWFALILWL